MRAESQLCLFFDSGYVIIKKSDFKNRLEMLLYTELTETKQKATVEKHETLFYLLQNNTSQVIVVTVTTVLYFLLSFEVCWLELV